MSDKNKKHEPVLLPKKKEETKLRFQDEPFLLSKDHAQSAAKPPYLLIILVLFGVLGAFWKMAVQKDNPIEQVKKPSKIKVYKGQ